MAAESRWNDIMNKLHDNSIEAYSPGTKAGECKAPYVVIKLAGASQFMNYSTDTCYYDIMCYVPKNEYSKMEPFVDTVQAAMKQLEPMIMYANQKTISYYDDTYKAHMVSIMYRNYRKL
jgi:hypothetical protein